MLTKDVLNLFQEAAGRKAKVAEVNAVQTYALLWQLIWIACRLCIEHCEGTIETGIATMHVCGCHAVLVHCTTNTVLQKLYIKLFSPCTDAS